MNTNEFLGMLIIALVTVLGVGTQISKPLVSTVKALTELNVAVKELTEKFKSFELTNHDDHKRIWEKSEAQDDTLSDHETRITLLESK